MSPATAIPLAIDPSSVQRMHNEAARHAPGATREAARQFEAMFLREVLRGARAASLADDALGSDQVEFYQEIFDAQLADSLAEGGGVGLARVIERQLGGAPEAPVTRPPPVPVVPDPVLAASRSLLQVDREEPSTRVEHRALPGPDATAPALRAAEPPEAADSMGVAVEAFAPGSAEDFVKALAPLARWAGEQLGVAPAAIVAQAALESGWGRRLPQQADGRSSFNLFGIKAGRQWNGAHASVATLEFVDGVATRAWAQFRAYDSLAEGIRDYVALLKNSDRYRGALRVGANAYAYATALARAGYATDPRYAAKLHAVLDSPVLKGLLP